ncbi:hypothetical protein TIFTF001_027290 [Ficus carica]|uniref:Uncharacterized protein n=1 Tax=Ficus carica TaxID=3494 RepID=A0AA88J019_FICCA|nr:hypothetical protein TIFTF001_027290 [Ficus carica]
MVESRPGKLEARENGGEVEREKKRENGGKGRGGGDEFRGRVWRRK